jgi:hypothetical protein
MMTSRPSPWPLRAAFLRAVHAVAPQLLDSLRAMLPADELHMKSFRASRICRDHLDDVPTRQRPRLELARGEWLTRLNRWAAPYRLPSWFIEAAEETLEVRRLLLLYEMREPMPTAWVPGEHVPEGAPVPYTHRELVWLARYQLLGASVHQLAADASSDRRTVRLAIQAAADTLGIRLREQLRGGRGLRAPGEARHLVIRRTAYVLLPLKGTVG